MCWNTGCDLSVTYATTVQANTCRSAVDSRRVIEITLCAAKCHLKQCETLRFNPREFEKLSRAGLWLDLHPGLFSRLLAPVRASCSQLAEQTGLSFKHLLSSLVSRSNAVLLGAVGFSIAELDIPIDSHDLQIGFSLSLAGNKLPVSKRPGLTSCNRLADRTICNRDQSK